MATFFSSLYILGLIAHRRNWFFELSPRMGKDWSLIALIATLIFGIAVLITVPLCFLASLLIRKIPFANRVL